ncbi:GNAT family N-acetyltransferase [Nocardioides alcanivorans]|uniref:GNAT family N-acetyltransferase n=1 Tax=Nocardioides alcanivorans TaxID=2897352 RepID=UPI001F264EA0|nr:GNAT family N-acetyltransferase [Nocardioides alcanivorans]
MAAPDVVLRPMRPEDLPEVVTLRNEGFLELDRRTLPRSAPEPQPAGDDDNRNWTERTGFVLHHDPRGCWVAEADDQLLGFATSSVRELTWMLHTFVVLPRAQGRGIGRALLEAAMAHGEGCLRGMLSASLDPAAARRYRLAGFSLHPQMMLTGSLDRALLPVVEKVREGTPADIDLMNSIDRQLRGSAHGVDHEWLTTHARLVVSDTTTGSGYAYLHPAGGAQLLAATNRRTAARLLWECLAATPHGRSLTQAHVTAANEWAIDVGVAARLALAPAGYLALRGMKPPAPYLHHGVFG